MLSRNKQKNHSQLNSNSRFASSAGRRLHGFHVVCTDLLPFVTTKMNGVPRIWNETAIDLQMINNKWRKKEIKHE